MSFFVSTDPQFEDANGDPIVGGKLYYGEENLDPINNPQDIFLDPALTIPAANPQILDIRGVPSQGSIYLQGTGALKYSMQLNTADDVMVFNHPSVLGVTEPADLFNIPPIIVVDSITVKGLTDAEVVIDSGSPSLSEGKLEYQEVTIPQWQWLRKAIVDGGNLLLRRVASANAPDEPIEFPLLGGAILRWLGIDRITVHSTGVDIEGEITKNKQVLVAGGTFLEDGTEVGEVFGIISAGNSGTGEYTVILDFFPLDEANLLVNTSAELGGDDQVTRGVGGLPASGTVIVFTSNGGTGARENSSSFTVEVFDLGRV